MRVDETSNFFKQRVIRTTFTLEIDPACFALEFERRLEDATYLFPAFRVQLSCPT